MPPELWAALVQEVPGQLAPELLSLERLVLVLRVLPEQELSPTRASE